MKKNEILTKEKLEELYYSGMKMAEIGRMYGLTGEGVAYRMKKFGIQTLPPEYFISVKAKQNGLKSLMDLTKEELEDLNKKYGRRKIAKMFGCSDMTISERRKQFGLPALQKTDRINLELPETFTIKQYKMLYGSLLGDGNIHVQNERSKTARFKESHSLKQLEYLQFKKNVLGDFISNEMEDNKVWNDGRLIKGMKIYSRFSKLFYELYEKFYVNGKRIIPDDFEDTLDGEILAYWFMDDGCYQNDYTIANNNPEVERLTKAFNNLGLDTVAKEVDSLTIYHFKNSERFFELVKDYIIPSMSYKIDISQRFDLPCINRPDLKKYLVNIPDNFEDDLVDFFHICGFPYSKPMDFKKENEIESVLKAKVDLSQGISSGHSQGNSYLASFFPNFYEARHYGKPTAKEYFDNKLDHILQDCYKYYGKPTLSLLRKVILEHHRVTNFRPVIAKEIMNKYGKETVLDPCGGYGGRMMGFFCSNMKRYVAVDPNSETVKNLKHLGLILNRSIEKDFEVNYQGFENFETEERFDLIFTSPPYFKKEIYSDEETQSCNKFKDYESWKNGFLKVFVEKCERFLKNDGIFVCNIDDIKINKKEFKLTEDFLKFCDGKFELIETIYFKHRNRYTGKNHGEPIFILKKI